MLFKLRFLSLVIVAMFAALLPMAAQAATAPSLGTADNFAVLAGTGAVVCTTGEAVTGNVGVFPGTTITGFNPSCTLAGTIHRGDPVAQQAHNDFLAAYTAVAAMGCTQTVSTAAFTGVNLSYAPGVICFPAAATFTNVTITLAGPANGVWIFKIGTSGTGALTGTGLTVVGAGTPCNANATWWTAQAATLTGSTFQGNLLAGSSITVTGGAFQGRALAKVAVSLTGPGTLTACGNTTGGGGGCGENESDHDRNLSHQDASDPENCELEEEDSAAGDKHEGDKPEASKHEDNRPEASKHEDNRPEASKPEANKPEASKHEDTKPEASKHEDNKLVKIKNKSVAVKANGNEQAQHED